MVTSGNTSGIVLPTVFLVTGLGTFILSLKHGISGINRTDIIAASVAAAAIAAWLILGTSAAVIGTNAAQVTALIATFNKLKNNPGTEDLTSWSLGGVAAFLSLSSVLLDHGASAGATLTALAVPLRCTLSCAIILGLAYMQHRGTERPITFPHFHLHRTAARGEFAMAA